MFDIDQALMHVIETEGSDLHLKVPSPPVIRRHGSLLPIPHTERVRPEQTEELLFHEVINTLADEERGLILVTGTTGSGKSTTLASMIDHINSNYAKHIV